MTLIETLIVLSIVGILLATAVPSLSRMLSRYRATTATNDFMHALAFTRSEALKRSRRVYLAPLDGRWRNGWAIFVDRNDNRVFDPLVGGAGDDLIALHDALPPSITMTHPTNPAREPFTDVGSPQRTYVMFDGHGYPRQRNGGFNIGSVVVTDRTGSSVSLRTVCLASFGRVRVIADRAGCS